MSIDLKRYNALQSRVEDLQRDADKAAGVLEQLKKELQEEFGCSTLKRAKRLLAEYEDQEQEMEREFAEALATFEAEFGEVLQ